MLEPGRTILPKISKAPSVNQRNVEILVGTVSARKPSEPSISVEENKKRDLGLAYRKWRKRRGGGA